MVYDKKKGTTDDLHEDGVLFVCISHGCCVARRLMI